MGSVMVRRPCVQFGLKRKIWRLVKMLEQITDIYYLSFLSLFACEHCTLVLVLTDLEI